MGSGNAEGNEVAKLESALLDDATAEVLGQASQVTKEAFEKGIMKILNLSIQGYPHAIRSTAAKRNELLRKYEGRQGPAVEDIKAQAAAITEEAKTWILGLVPFVGLPASVLWPTWRLLRRVCLMAGVYGHDLDMEETRAKVINAFGGLRAVPAAEFAVEHAVQLVWRSFVGPVAKLVPVGILVSKVANIEGAVMAVVGQETFSEGQRSIPEEVYREPLDSQPRAQDYLELTKTGAEYAMLQALKAGGKAVKLGMDAEQRTSAASAAQARATTLVGQATTVGRGLVAATPGAAAAAPDVAAQLGKQGLSKGLAIGKALLPGTKKP